ncbi:hydroxyacid oxidase 1 [Exaiptasia diaphana]|uniref:(S)-2-hydroxy-acid oxidase n=1 Tax=Exaiptasia diaphana TaxID=2652724 RepID=A0A913X0B2_EXADI|nr:hydroxyacid oxidase 1 [Exaiptasia diaphana]KXJ30026.1 Hydroxyacid oxidase 1 [Exaiptasia diaphana]
MSSKDSSVQAYCLEDFEKKAIPRLSDRARRFFVGGADEEFTLRDNVNAFKRIWLRPRMLRGITEVDMSTTVLGEQISMPICAAPTGFQKMAHQDGEVGSAIACARSKTMVCISTYSSSSIDDIANAPFQGLRWLQLYVLKDVQQMTRLIRDAEKAGFKAVVLTVDATVIGNRRATAMPGFFDGLEIPMITNSRSQKLESHPDKVLDDSITWDIISWVKSITKLPVIIKGILTAEDAKLAVQHGADAIIVSNHGGRQLDGVLATIDALPEVVSAVNGQVEVYLDGGVRLGTDVLKALALGARAVFIGRPVLWGLAVQGSEGVHQVLELLRAELRTAMILSGCSSVKDITSSLVSRQQCQCRL